MWEFCSLEEPHSHTQVYLGCRQILLLGRSFFKRMKLKTHQNCCSLSSALLDHVRDLYKTFSWFVFSDRFSCGHFLGCSMILQQKEWSLNHLKTLTLTLTFEIPSSILCEYGVRIGLNIENVFLNDYAYRLSIFKCSVKLQLLIIKHLLSFLLSGCYLLGVYSELLVKLWGMVLLDLGSRRCWVKLNSQ